MEHWGWGVASMRELACYQTMQHICICVKTTSMPCTENISKPAENKFNHDTFVFVLHENLKEPMT